MIKLSAGDARCTISPDEGGRLASLSVGRQSLLIERPQTALTEPDPMSWGCYAMAPWAGRVRHGRFMFRGIEHRVPVNLGPHAIHGTVFTRAWHVDLVEDRASATLTCAFGPDWPFGGYATHCISLGPDSVVCDLALTSTTHEMPAVLGWHPWFVKPQSATLRFGKMFERDGEGIPTGTLVTPPPGPWDDCFVEPLEPLTLQYDTCTVTISSDCDHWVIYDQPVHATCVEPQSAPPNAFNLDGDNGPVVLSPGQTLRRTMTIGWMPARDDIASKLPEDGDSGPRSPR